MIKLQEKEGILDNITVVERYRDNELVGYELRAHEGYMLDDTRKAETDEEGNEIEKTYSQVFGCPADFDLTQIVAVKCEEGQADTKEE